MKIKFLVLIILFGSITSCNLLNHQKKLHLAKEKTAPFSKMDFKNDGIYVDLGSTTYKWLKMDTLEITNVVDMFEEYYGIKWQQRFSEDFVEYLHKLDIYPNQQEIFTLEDQDKNIKVIKLKFTAEKREKAKNHFESEYDKDIDLNKFITNQEALEDLDQLEQLIKQKYAYAFLNEINVHEEIQTIKNVLLDSISTYNFALEIGKLLNKFGDGHTRIHNVKFYRHGILPFAVKPFNGKVICLKNGKLLNEEYPFLYAINDIKVSKLLEISDTYFTSKASPQYQNRAKVVRLNRIGEILRLANAKYSELKVELVSKDGQTTSEVMAMGKPAKRSITVPFEVKHFEDIGYLRIKSMVPLNDETSFMTKIDELKNTKGLVIDVRDNGGGLRDILLKLAPHFINKKQGFVVGNVAQLRTDKISKNHDLSDRYLYQKDDAYFKEDMKLKLKTWSRDFSKNVKLKDSLYSSDYYLYIESLEKPYFANTPTVVLMNEGCYSATDIFLSTFKEIDGVTLVGTPSGGGSGRSKRYKLKNSLIEIRLSSIVSFQPNGSLYDGVGVYPDIQVPQSRIFDLLKETDTQLEFALKFLNKPE